MEIIPTLANRRSKRAISSEKLSQEQIERLLHAAHLAPSAFNNQSWRMIAITGEAELKAIHNNLPPANSWVTQAPVLFVFATKPSLSLRLDGGRDYALFDTGLAAMSLLVQAEHEKLIAHPIAGYNSGPIAKELKIPEDFVVITIIAVGKPSVDLSALNDYQKNLENGPRVRKPLNEVAFANNFITSWK